MDECGSKTGVPKQTKAIIFDFYGVICNDIGATWYKTKVAPELICELKSQYDAPSDIGEVSEQEFFDGIGKVVNRTGEDVRREWLESAGVNVELVDFIKELKKRCKIAVCSNTAGPIFREILEKNKLEQLFDVIVASSEVGMIKPDREIFEYTLNQLGISPNEAIFIDDRVENVEAAADLDIKSFLYKDIQALREDLRGVY